MVGVIYATNGCLFVAISSKGESVIKSCAVRPDRLSLSSDSSLPLSPSALSADWYPAVIAEHTFCRVLRQVSEQVQRSVHTARLAGVGRPHNEFTVLQLQREHEREEDKARLRVQQGLLSGPDSERQRGFSQTEQTQFRPEAGDARREFPGAARTGGLRTPVLPSLLQRHHSPVSTRNFIIVFAFVTGRPFGRAGASRPRIWVSSLAQDHGICLPLITAPPVRRPARISRSICHGFRRSR